MEKSSTKTTEEKTRQIEVASRASEEKVNSFARFLFPIGIFFKCYNSTWRLEASSKLYFAFCFVNIVSLAIQLKMNPNNYEFNILTRS